MRQQSPHGMSLSSHLVVSR